MDTPKNPVATKFAWVAGSNSWGCQVPEDLNISDTLVLEELGIINDVGPWRLLEIAGTPVLYVQMHGWYPNGRGNGQVEAWEAAPRVVSTLKQFGVKYALGDASVGGIQSPLEAGKPLPPGSLVVPTGFRMAGVPPRPTFRPRNDDFFRVGAPFCEVLRTHLRTTANSHFGTQLSGQAHPEGELRLYDAAKARYVCTMWGRIETEDEIDVFRQLGDHVVGMSIGHEAHWMRALGIHFAVINVVANHAESGIPEKWVGDGQPGDMAAYYSRIAVPLGQMFVEALKAVIDSDKSGSLDGCKCDKFRLVGFD